MGSRGPRPTPTEVLAASGSWRAAARTKAKEPRAPSLPPAPPEGIAENEELLAEWSTLCDRISAIQTLSHVDAAAIERYAHLAVRYRRAIQYVLQKGQCYNILTNSGDIKYRAVNPEVAEANSCAAQLLKLEHEFGLTPASRVGRTGGGPSDIEPGDEEDLELLG